MHRITPEEALQHEWILEVRVGAEEMDGIGREILQVINVVKSDLQILSP